MVPDINKNVMLVQHVSQVLAAVDRVSIMKFNRENCQLLCYRQNEELKYLIQDARQPQYNTEKSVKDVWVIMSDDLTYWAQQGSHNASEKDGGLAVAGLPDKRHKSNDGVFLKRLWYPE